MRIARRLLVAAGLLAACNRASPDPAPQGAASDGDVAEVDTADTSNPTSGIGDGCLRPDDAQCKAAFKQPQAQGSCGSARVCLLSTCEFLATNGDERRQVSYHAWTAGYCVAPCKGKNNHPDSSLCPIDSLCSSSDRQEAQQCLRACKTDLDCRVADNYTCQVDGLGAYADQHLPKPRGQTHSCRPNTACAATGAEPDAGFSNRPVPLAPGVLAAAEGNVATDGKGRVVVTYIGYWPHDGIFDQNVVAVGCTLDGAGGCTWSATTANHFDRPGFTPSTGYVVDPSVAVDAITGDFYWAWLDYVAGSKGWLRVSRSSDGGQTWSTPVDAAADVADKPWIVARGGVVWAVGVGDGLQLARSTDAGKTWARHKLVVDGESSFYPQASVDGSGNFFLAWAGEQGAATADQINHVLRVAMWPAGKSCAVLPATEDCFVGKTVAVEALEFSNDRIAEVPFAAALNPADGSFWLTYVRGDRYFASDVVAVRCTTGASGAACDAPVRVSQPGASATCGVRVVPAIAFDESGVGHVAWMDNRYGKGDRARYWYARSTDGKVWNESVLSNEDSVFTVGKEFSAGWFGDYTGIAAAGGRVIATWSDSRNLPPTGIQPTGFVRQRMFLGIH